ncbi:hypothetical protein NU195Hw_g7656t1 [Hortaea werneckii]
MKLLPTDRTRVLRIALVTLLSLGAVLLALAILQHVLVPVLVWVAPALERPFYDLGFFGPYPTQDYVSFNLSSPRASIVEWDESCDDGFVFLDPNGPSVDHRGPLIVDAKGRLVWTSDAFETTTNLKLQEYEGAEYLTFWSGHKAKTMGTGLYYMMDNNYTIAHTVDAVGQDLHGDLHEFKITKDNTALLTVYNLTNADLTGMGWFRGANGWITDSVFQEVDIATGELLFEWSASHHFKAELSFMWNPFGGYSDSSPFDFFHINSVEKDRNGNYLISSRHFHSVMTVDGKSGEVLWELGGHSTDFEDLSDGKASGFSWQHDARWLDEEEGLLSLFDNGVAWPHVDVPYSEGRIIKLDLDAMTAELVQNFISPSHPRSSSQGSIIPLQTPEGADHIFIGWGSSAAFSEFTPEGQLLCETHFAASGLWWWERIKSYRAYKTPSWSATPKDWDPSAQIESGSLFVSWNGATDVAFWELSGRKAVEDGDAEWQVIDIIEKEDFEDTFILPSSEASFDEYRVAALDRDHGFLRYSNTMSPPPTSGFLGFISYALMILSALAVVAGVGGYWLGKKKGWALPDWRRYAASAQAVIDRSKYQKLW